MVARPGPGGEKRRGGRAPYHKEFEAIRPFLLPCAATGVSLLAGWCRSGATPRGAAVDAHRDTTAKMQQAARTADGGVVNVSRALSGVLSASRIHAQRVARFDPL